MKNGLLIFCVFIIFFASCNSTSNQGGTTASSSSDTLGLAEYRAWRINQVNSQLAFYTKTSHSDEQNADKKGRYYSVSNNEFRYKKAKYNNGGYMRSESDNSAKVVKRNRWSMAAKGTAIGVGGGAVLGAIINKRNPLVGGIVGGILGGAAGYGIGYTKDKPSGRY